MSAEITTLPNGLRVVTEEMPNLQTVSLGIWVGTGARFEKADEHGISHLLEHMAFKGTPSRTARDIAEQIEAVGGDLNAATSLENTSYYVRILKDDVELAISLLADILQNPLFDEEELVREKDVILQEIAAAGDSPDDLVYDLAQEKAFPAQPLGRPILGTAQSVMDITAEDLTGYMNRHYTADRMIIGAAGAVKHDEVVSYAERYFSGLKSSNGAKPIPAIYRGGTGCSSKDFEQSHIVLAFNGASYKDDDFYTSQVFSGLLGGGMSSRLFQEVREKRGLCYAIYTFSWGLSDAGLFGIHAATGADQMGELLRVINGELSRATSTKPTDAELSRAKAQLKAGLLMSLESSAARAEQLARQLHAFGRPLETKELLDRVEAVTPEDIQMLAERLLTEATPSCATVGAVVRPDTLENILYGGVGG